MGLPDTLPPDIPPVNLLFVVDPVTLDLVHAELIFAPSSGRFHAVIEATNHDQPLAIEAPGSYR